MQLDPRTLGVASNILALGMTALVVLLWLSKEMYPGFGRWASARLIGILTLLFSVQIGRWPHSIVGADACGMLSSILSLEACREFIGLRPAIRWAYFGAGALVLQLTFVEVFSHSSQINYVEMTFAWGMISAWTGATLLHELPSGSNRGRITTGCVFLANSLIHIARSFYFVVHPAGTLVDSSPWNLAFLAANLIYGLFVNVSFILMHYERVLTEKAAEAARTAAANRALTELKANLEETVRQKTAELVQAQKLESLGQLAGGVAHDFNNILTVINGYSSRLLTQLAPGHPMYVPITQIGKAGGQAAALTRQLLTFSRQQKDEPSVISVDSLLQDLTQMLRRLIGDDIEIVLKLGAGAYNVRADRPQIEQVVMNLAVNARDAMPNGGTLSMETALNTEKYVVLSVTDTGIGMTPEIQERVFDPFFTTKGPAKGTGLGLSTAYGIVKKSGGAITVNSTPGLGTTFRVLLPSVESASPEPDSRTEPQMLPGGTETILLVEDQTEVRELVRGVLEEHGYRMIEAATGQDAVALARASHGPIHLLITDMVLPGMNGVEIARSVSSAQPGIRVLRMSGYTDSMARRFDDGTPFIQKPFAADTLLKQVRSILDAARDPALASEHAG